MHKSILFTLSFLTLPAYAHDFQIEDSKQKSSSTRAENEEIEEQKNLSANDPNSATEKIDLLHNPIFNKEIPGVHGAQNRSLFDINKDSSTGTTQKFPLEMSYAKGLIPQPPLDQRNSPAFFQNIPFFEKIFFEQQTKYYLNLKEIALKQQADCKLKKNSKPPPRNLGRHQYTSEECKAIEEAIESCRAEIEEIEKQKNLSAQARIVFNYLKSSAKELFFTLEGESKGKLKLKKGLHQRPFLEKIKRAYKKKRSSGKI